MTGVSVLKFSFLIKIQKDAQGSIFPLRVYMTGVPVPFHWIRTVSQVSISDQIMNDEGMMYDDG